MEESNYNTTKHFIFIFLIISVGLSFAQNRKMDSLWAIFNNKAQADTNRLKAINDIVWSYSNINPDTAILIAEQGLQLARITKQKKYEGRVFASIGVLYQNKGNYPKALENQLKSLKIMKEIGNGNGIARCHNNIGNVYLYQSNYPGALEYYRKALKQKEEIGDKKSMGVCYSNIGNVYLKQSDFPQALKY
ncbi:MAG TPA: tetratricopeptide repeat protein, partial [Nitrosopumilaceae archaeon]|nr:tetratricopeptide repeat protein [Nitrosopumilaceae archaeon]